MKNFSCEKLFMWKFFVNDLFEKDFLCKWFQLIWNFMFRNKARSLNFFLHIRNNCNCDNALYFEITILNYWVIRCLLMKNFFNFSNIKFMSFSFNVKTFNYAITKYILRCITNDHIFVMNIHLSFRHFFSKNCILSRYNWCFLFVITQSIWTNFNFDKFSSILVEKSKSIRNACVFFNKKCLYNFWNQIFCVNES